MKRKTHFYLFAILFLVSISGLAQLEQRANIFDSVQNIEQLNKALITINPKLRPYSRVPIKDVVLPYDKKSHFYSKISDSLGILQPYSFADIDQNGCTDVLLAQESEDVGPFIILMFPQNKYQIFDLNLNNICSLSYSKVLRIKDKPTIIQLQILRSGSDISVYNRKFFPGFESIELVYKFDNFIEYNPNPTNENIKQIDFIEPRGKAGQQEGISILANGDLKLCKTGMFPDATGSKSIFKTNHYRGKMAIQDKQFLSELVNYLNVNKLGSNYTIPGLRDGGESTLHIITDSIDKTIKDYGMAGSFGLKILYHKSDLIIQNTDWQLDPKQ
ncbi:hypothetical protein [Rhizosphaericola mali]|uniref:Uncharacterized protein n=1 Tax=Rhizosphaericola mali TaxID=2545455 RepID=A0A5P2G5F3_9BACT|nr:hypothetical protein [Rhizosphaericola mali]QES89908.1 hypothetical protein E0W69_014990 [Rhizosphaericola mali]